MIQSTSVASSVYVTQSAAGVPLPPAVMQFISVATFDSVTSFSQSNPECVNFETVTTSLLETTITKLSARSI